MKKPVTAHQIEKAIKACLTRHAWQRMTARGLSAEALQSVMQYGRVAFVREAAIYAIGRKEVERFAKQGVDLRSCEGIQVVCTTNGTILTVYRNRNFRGLRPCRRRYKSVA